MGRTLVFLARMMQDGWSRNPREIAIDEKSAVLVEPDGRATIVGQGKGAYFLRPAKAAETCEANEPLTFHEVAVYKAPTGSHFNLSTWTGDGGVSYMLSVEQGVIHSSQADHSIY